MILRLCDYMCQFQAVNNLASPGRYSLNVAMASPGRYSLDSLLASSASSGVASDIDSEVCGDDIFSDVNAMSSSDIASDGIDAVDAGMLALPGDSVKILTLASSQNRTSKWRFSGSDSDVWTLLPPCFSQVPASTCLYDSCWLMLLSATAFVARVLAWSAGPLKLAWGLLESCRG